MLRLLFKNFSLELLVTYSLRYIFYITDLGIRFSIYKAFGPNERKGGDGSGPIFAWDGTFQTFLVWICLSDTSDWMFSDTLCQYLPTLQKLVYGRHQNGNFIFHKTFWNNCMQTLCCINLTVLNFDNVSSNCIHCWNYKILLKFDAVYICLDTFLLNITTRYWNVIVWSKSC